MHAAPPPSCISSCLPPELPACLSCCCCCCCRRRHTRSLQVNIGRASEGCGGYLAVGSATVGQCANTNALVGSSSSAAGAQSWLIENADEPGMVYISNEARRAAGCNMRYLGANPDCSVIETGLFALGHSTALLKWRLIFVPR